MVMLFLCQKSHWDFALSHIIRIMKQAGRTEFHGPFIYPLRGRGLCVCLLRKLIFGRRDVAAGFGFDGIEENFNLKTKNGSKPE